MRNRSRRFRRATIIALLFSIVATGLSIGPAAANYGALFWATSQDEVATFGPNEEMVIELGTIQYVTDCSATQGIKDVFIPFADVYLVPTGSTVLSGVPNVVQGRGFYYETIGITAPSGNVGPGTYDVVYDECQDGEYNPELDSRFVGAAVVGDIPADVPPLPHFVAMKDAARQAATEWLAASAFFTAYFSAIDLFGGRAGAQAQLAQQVYEFSASKATGVAVADARKGAMIALLNSARHYAGIAADPPNPDFQMPTVLPAQETFDFTEDEPLLEVVEGLTQEASLTAAVTRSLLDSLERYQGADAESDGEWALSQARDAKRYADLLASRAAPLRGRVEEVRTALQADTRDLDAPAAAMEAIRARIAGSGYLMDDRRMLANAGLPENELAAFRTWLTGQKYGFSEAGFSANLLALADNADAVASGASQFSSSMTSVIATLEGDPYAPDRAAAVGAGGPYVASVGTPIQLHAQPAVPADVAAYAWDTDGDADFDDATGRDPTVTLAQPGRRLLGLEVTSTAGRRSVSYASAVVAETRRAPVFTGLEPAESDISGTGLVSFAARATDADDQFLPVTALIDGKYIVTSTNLNFSTGAVNPGSPTHLTAGVHHIQVVAEAEGKKVTHEWRLTVDAEDTDADGWWRDADCGPADPAINPGVAEVEGNGTDDDCNPATGDTSTNTAPVAMGYHLVVEEDVATDVLLNATDGESDPTTVTITRMPQHGTIYQGAEYRYSPDRNFSGSDSLEFTASDGRMTSAPATITIEVQPAPERPFAFSSTVRTPPGTPVDVQLGARSPDGGALTFLAGAAPAHGGVVLGADGLARYTPLAGYSGPDSFGFIVREGSLESTGVVSVLVTSAQVAPSGRDSKGREFWGMFNSNYDAAPTTTIFIASASATTGTVSVPGVDFAVPFTTSVGQVTTVEVPPVAMHPLGGGIADSAIHVTAADEVSVYGLNQIQFTTDAFTALPVDTTGRDYRILTFSGNPGGSLFGVVATEDNTVVTVTPTGKVPGVVLDSSGRYRVHLDRGEAYQPSTSAEGGPQQDLTGTRVQSDKRVAAFGASWCANVPSTHYGYCDHLTEQLPPVESWGKSFLTQPLATRSGGDTFRVLASEDGTTVRLNGEFLAVLDAGDFHQTLIGSASAITADRPILMAQYSNGSTFDNSISDPFMMLVFPTEQFDREYVVSTPATGFATNFLNVVVPAVALPSLRVDGNPVADEVVRTPIPGTAYAGLSIPVELGSHTVRADRPFGLSVYGYNTDDSYGYPGGTSLEPIARIDSLELTPVRSQWTLGQTACITATVQDEAGNGLPGVPVTFTVAGPHPFTGDVTTTAAGIAAHCYPATSLGTDEVSASAGLLTATAEAITRQPPEGTFFPLTPARILDTRDPGNSAVGQGATRNLKVAGKGGVPSFGASAAVLNVTVDGPTAASYLTVFPSGVPRPTASNLNYVPGLTVPNLVVAKLGDDGSVSLFNNVGTAHVVVDVVGWYAAPGSITGDRFEPMSPIRVLDTRDASGPTAGAAIPRQSDIRLRVRGVAGVPESASAVMLNVTADQPTAASYLTVWPGGIGRPLASNLNFVAGKTVANAVVAKIGSDGTLGIFNSDGSTHVIVDVLGYFAYGPPSEFSHLTPMSPTRVLDTRTELGGFGGMPVGPGAEISVPVTVRGIPADASAVVLNVTVDAPTASSYLTVWPAGATRPLASSLNFVAGQVVPNLVVAKVGSNGKVNVFNSAGQVHVIFDVVGWYKSPQ